MTLFAATSAGAQLAGAPKHLRITPLVHAATGEKVSEGAAFDVALVTRPEPGWHGYWGENPGDAGFPPKFVWEAPPGTTFGAWRWPVPETLKLSGLMNYVYSAPFAPMVRVQLPGKGADRLKLHLSYLVCTDSICVPEEQDVAVDLTGRGTGGGAADPAFDRWRSALPRPLGAVATYQVDARGVRIAVPYPTDAPLADAYFFPITTGAVDYAAPQVVTRDGERLVIATGASAGGKPAGAIEGVLRIGRGQGLRLRAVPGVVPAATGDAGWVGKALAAFGLAVLGGLVLNVMPCVFPILSLKALSLARSGASARAARGEALAYTAGVVLVCLGLGAAILALRAGGASVGWAFQLQNPYMLLLLLLLTAGLAFNLAGLFEIPTPPLGDAAGSGGAFATGALAAIIATPCTGPFMGAALGAALVLPWAAALAVFAGLGLGLALPFLLIGFVPALRNRLPRPGAWMARVRHALSIPMFATAIALGWVLGRQAGVDALGFALALVLLLAIVLWAVGGAKRRGRGVGLALLGGLTVIAVVGLSLLPVAPRTATASVAGEEPFGEARLAALRAARTPVFAYFTADWCLTCKVNERVAIEPARDALRAKGVTVLVGDWTNGDPALGRFIEAHNRAGVPLYLYYAPGAEARVLPQVLTPGMLANL